MGEAFRFAKAKIKSAPIRLWHLPPLREGRKSLVRRRRIFHKH
jgi:hypothetical protein